MSVSDESQGGLKEEKENQPEGKKRGLSRSRGWLKEERSLLAANRTQSGRTCSFDSQSLGYNLFHITFSTLDYFNHPYYTISRHSPEIIYCIQDTIAIEFYYAFIKID